MPYHRINSHYQEPQSSYHQEPSTGSRTPKYFRTIGNPKSVVLDSHLSEPRFAPFGTQIRTFRNRVDNFTAGYQWFAGDFWAGNILRR